MAIKQTETADGLRIEPSNQHAVGQFRDRIDSDISLLMSCWHDGAPIEAPDRHYDWARVYDGGLVETSVVMFATDTRGEHQRPDGLITTVVPASWVGYSLCK